MARFDATNQRALVAATLVCLATGCSLLFEPLPCEDGNCDSGNGDTVDAALERTTRQVCAEHRWDTNASLVILRGDTNEGLPAVLTDVDSPSLHSDGTKILFSSRDGNGLYKIFEAASNEAFATDFGNAKPIVTGAVMGDDYMRPRASNDGLSIRLFRRYQDEQPSRLQQGRRSSLQLAFPNAPLEDLVLDFGDGTDQWPPLPERQVEIYSSDADGLAQLHEYPGRFGSVGEEEALLREVNRRHAGGLDGPWISQDGLAMMYTADEGGTSHDRIWLVEREAKAEPWDEEAVVVEDSIGDLSEPWSTENLCCAYFARNAPSTPTQIFRVQRLPELGERVDCVEGIVPE